MGDLNKREDYRKSLEIGIANLDVRCKNIEHLFIGSLVPTAISSVVTGYFPSPISWALLATFGSLTGVLSEVNASLEKRQTELINTRNTYDRYLLEWDQSLEEGKPIEEIDGLITEFEQSNPISLIRGRKLKR